MRPSWGSLCQTTAVSVATILGTGILGLPVSLHASGLKPFLLTFTLTLFAQLSVVAAMTELLQRAHHKHPANSHFQPLHQLEAQSPSTAPTNHSPSLHSIAAHFISNPVLRSIFNFIVLLHFLCILSAYALAGPQAYLTLFTSLNKLPHFLPTVVFVLTCTFLVVVLSETLLPSLTVATFTKATLLAILVAVTLVRGLSIHHDVVNNWNPFVLQDPFLMGTIALSGVVNLMPVTFQACIASLEHMDDNVMDAAFVSSYRMATYLAIAICYVLNVAWCYAVLLVVPQLPPAVASSAADTFGAPANASLSTAEELGQISTVPLIQTLQARNDTLDSIVSLLVNIFIALSVTVSFLVMSMGMKHFIDGEVQSHVTTDSTISVNTNRRIKYLVYFSIILIVALTNPAAIFKIMEGSTSLALNIEAGLFVLYMLHTSRKSEEFTSVPAPLSSLQVTVLIVFGGFYFLSAVFVDLFLYIPSTIF